MCVYVRINSVSINIDLRSNSCEKSVLFSYKMSHKLEVRITVWVIWGLDGLIISINEGCNIYNGRFSFGKPDSLEGRNYLP